MSPQLLYRRCEGRGFPRVSGDEPTPRPHEEPDVAFSPRERG